MDPCFSKLLHFMKSINDANMMEQNESRGDGCHLPYFGCPASESLSRCREDSTLRVSVEIRAHGSPLTLEVEKARHLLPSLLHLQSLDIWSVFGQSGALPWPEPQRECLKEPFPVRVAAAAVVAMSRFQGISSSRVIIQAPALVVAQASQGSEARAGL